MQKTLYSPLFIRAMWSRGAHYVGCVVPSSVVRTTTVSTLVGGAGLQPSWLLGPGLCGGCQLLEGSAWFWHGLMWGWGESRAGGCPLVGGARPPHDWTAWPAGVLEGGLQNDTCQPRCPHDRRSSPNGCCQHPCTQGESQRPPASFWVSLKSVCGSDPGSFQIIACALGLRGCENLHMPFKNRVSVFFIPLTLLYTRSTGLQSQMFWGLIFPVQDPLLRSLMLGSDPSLLGEKLCNCDYPPVCGPPTQVCGSWLYCISTPPPHLVVVPSLYLYCGNLFC